MPKLLQLCNHRIICVRYIPTKRDIRHVTSLGEGQCLSEAKEVPRA